MKYFHAFVVHGAPTGEDIYLEIPGKCDTACLPLLAPQGPSEDNRLAFGGMYLRTQRRHSGPVPTLFRSVTWAELCRVDGTPSVPPASVELGLAPGSAKW